MKRRMRLKRKYHLFQYHGKKGPILIWILLSLVIALFFTFRFLNRHFTPILLDYAEVETKRLSMLIVNNAINEQIAESLNIDDLFIITKNGDGEIKTIDFNPVVVNKVLGEVTQNIHNNFRYIEEGKVELLTIAPNILSNYDQEKLKKGIIYEIPSGVIFKNALLSNLGPKIPVKISVAGDIYSNIVTKISNYGINNALVEVNIYVKITEKVLLPFTSKPINFENTIPVALKLIQGTVPNYYFNGMEQNSPSVTFPVMPENS